MRWVQLKNLKYILIGLLFLFISCSEDPPTILPVELPPEPYYNCDIDQTRNCTIEENIGVCQLGVQICLVATLIAMRQYSRQSDTLGRVYINFI